MEFKPSNFDLPGAIDNALTLAARGGTSGYRPQPVIGLA